MPPARGRVNSCPMCSLEVVDTPIPSPSHCANPRPCVGSAAETTISSGTSVRNPSAAKPSDRDPSFDRVQCSATLW